MVKHLRNCERLPAPIAVKVSELEARVAESPEWARRGLVVTPARVAAAAAELWGRSVEEERDRRLNERPDVPGRNDLAGRVVRSRVAGRITRELIEELADELGRRGRRGKRQAKK